MNSPKKLDQIVTENSSLSLITKQICRFRAHKKTVLCHLPKDYADHCKYVILKENSLILYVDSPAWTNRFRYLCPELLRELKKHSDFAHLAAVGVKTLTNQPGPHFNKSKTKLGKISLESIKSLAQTAEGKAEPLRSQLLRLAAHLYEQAQQEAESDD